jgi:hypothetical protein
VDEAARSWVPDMNAVDWSALEHAYGPASDVPPMFLTIAFGEPPEAIGAAGELGNNLNHQGSIYPATGPAVPFVIAALKVTTAGPAVRSSLLSLLSGVASGGGFLIGEALNAGVGDSLHKASNRLGGLSIAEVSGCVWSGIDVYSGLLERDVDADVRMHTAHLLGQLIDLGQKSVPVGIPDGVGAIVRLLLARLNSELDGLTLSSVAMALGRAIAVHTSVRPALRDLMAQPSAAESARVAAAIGLVEGDEGRYEEIPAVDLLIQTLLRAAETDKLFQPQSGDDAATKRRSPWVWGRLRFLLAKVLCRWSAPDDARMQRVLPALLVNIREANGYTAESDLGPIMQWLWPGRRIRWKTGVDGKPDRELPPAVTHAELSGIKRSVLEECHANQKIWIPQIGNTSLTFMQVGLPTSRAAIGRLLEGR